MRIELVDGYGCGIAKHSERLVLKYPVPATPDGQTGRYAKRDVPVLFLDHLLLGSRGVNISTDAVNLCCERGIPITVLDWRGRPLGRFSSPALHGSASVRRAQLTAFAGALGASFARELVHGKLLNQADNLRYFAKNRKVRAPEEYDFLISAAERIHSLAGAAESGRGESADEARQALMMVEAEAAKNYWASLHKIYGAKTGFERREQRGTRNPLNAALNYAYGVLQAEVWNSTVLAGLEPYAGFLHVDRPGRLSFVLDMMEEFRPVVADRVVFGLAAKGWRIGIDDAGWLDRPTKLKLVEAIGRRLDSTLELAGRQVRVRNIIQLQCRDAARHFQGKLLYRSVRQRW